MIIESDSQIAIQVITGVIKAPSQIYNIIVDSFVLASAIRAIKFRYCNTSADKLADTKAKKAHHCTA